MRKLTKLILPVSALALAIPGLALQAQAQGADDDAIEEIITTGLRGKPRSAVDSAVPIDTFDASQIEAISHTDTQDILQTLVPSYNVARQPISDGSSFIRPATLRGLPSHHTLVLVNGKRRHRSTLVGIGGAGEQGPDVATIPSSAIQSIEVLRDGASAQYGSDAIAGVINFNLKENRDGFNLALSTGQYYEGDGAGYTLSGNVGLPLGDNGFLSLTGEVDSQDFSERDHQYCENWFCVDSTNPIFNNTPDVDAAQNRGFVNGVGTSTDPFLTSLQEAYPGGVDTASVQGSVVQPWGQPNTESARFFYNAGIDLDNGMELYSFGNYSTSKGDGSFFYRYPFNGTIETLRRADGSLYNPLQIFPGGFTPRFEGEVTDIGALGGIRGSSDGGFSYDASVRYGQSEIDYRLFNTINPSYGPDTPTDFKPGKLSNTELQVQLDLSNEFDVGMDTPLVFAYGLSYMDEEYDVQQSKQVESYAAGPHALSDPYGFCVDDGTGTGNMVPSTTGGQGDWTSSIGGVAAVAGDQVTGLNCNDSSDPAFKVVGVGSNGFPGYSPEFSEVYSRDSYAVYGDLSTDVSESLFLQAAVRYEDYSDFGDQLVYKIAGRYRINESFALRGSFGTGFRAPTPGQQGTTNVSTRLPNGLPVATGLFPPSGDVAQALGATPLKAEESTSYTVGFTADLQDLTVTVDFYNIDIDDRFNAISTRDVSPIPPGQPGFDQEAYDNFLALQNAGVLGAETIGGVFYFANAFDSNTKGVDIVASYPIDWGNGQDTNLQFAWNYNESSLESDASDFLNEEDQFDFENVDPNIRWNLTANHSFTESLSFMVRGRYYGESENSNSSGNLVIQKFDSVMMWDMEGSYRFNDNWRLVVGARNAFDTFPDKTDRVASNNDQCCGRDYVSGSVVPWMGGYYYGRVTMSF